LRDTVYIQANPQQLLGAKLAAHAVKRNSRNPGSFDVVILNSADFAFWADAEGAEYLWSGTRRVWHNSDLQSFTPIRFMPPELQGNQGRAVVIDPDCFFIGDVRELFDMDMEGKAIWCARRGSATRSGKNWATSMMLLDCAKLRHWQVATQFREMFAFKRDYTKWINLKYEPKDSIGQLPRVWNDLDRLTPETKVLHNTRRRTQPWKTGLPVDFTIKEKKRTLLSFAWLFGPPKVSAKAIGKYKQHPDPAQEALFVELLRECVANGTITREEIVAEMHANHIRHDALELLERPPHRTVRSASSIQSQANAGLARTTKTYLALAASFVGCIAAGAYLAPPFFQQFSVDDGPFDRISAMLCVLSVALAFGSVCLRAMRLAPWPVLATMQIGLLGFLNAKGSQAGPIPYEFSELIGSILEPSLMTGETWSAVLLTVVLFTFLICSLVAFRNHGRANSSHQVLLCALLLAIGTPLVGDLVNPTSSARAIVEALELVSSAGLSLAAGLALVAALSAKERRAAG
jgi:hypothetical protein